MLVQALNDRNFGLITALIYGAAMDRGSLDVNVTDKKGRSLLVILAHHGRVDNIHYAITAGANLYARDMNGKTALLVAKQSGQTGAVRALKSRGAIA